MPAVVKPERPLRQADVLAIRQLCREGKLSQRQIARSPFVTANAILMPILRAYFSPRANLLPMANQGDQGGKAMRRPKFPARLKKALGVILKRKTKAKKKRKAKKKKYVAPDALFALPLAVRA